MIFDTDEVDTGEEPDTSGDKTPVVERTPSASKSPAAANTVNEKWVSGICTAFTGWVMDLEVANQKLQTSIDDASSASDLKKLLVTFMRTGQTETKNLQKDIAGLKAPEVKDGPAIHKVFVDASGDLVKIFDGFVSDAEKVGTTSLSQVESDVEELSDKVGTAFDEVSESFDALDDFDAPAIEKLFETRPECAGL